jgi:hypothetical protein
MRELTRLLERAAETEARLGKLVEEVVGAEERTRGQLRDAEARNTRLQQLMSEIVDPGGQAMDGLREYVDERLEVVRGEIEDLMDVRLDDARLDVKIEIQDYVDERLEGAVEEIKESLQRRGVLLYFND